MGFEVSESEVNPAHHCFTLLSLLNNLVAIHTRICITRESRERTALKDLPGTLELDGSEPGGRIRTLF